MIASPHAALDLKLHRSIMFLDDGTATPHHRRHKACWRAKRRRAPLVVRATARLELYKKCYRLACMPARTPMPSQAHQLGEMVGPLPCPRGARPRWIA